MPYRTCRPHNRRRICGVVALLAASVLCPRAAYAQYVMEFAQTYNAPMSNFISGTFLNQQTLIEAIAPGKPQAQTRKAAPPFPLAPPQVQRSAAELAEAMSPQHRARMEKTYAQMMPPYHQIEAKLGWPRDDLAGAITALLAGNYMAMTGTELSDTAVIAAARQLRESAAIQNLLRTLAPAERRRLYEQCAMLGTFMTLANKTAAQQQPQAITGLRQSARANLQAVLGPAAEQLRFDATGVHMR